MVRPETRPDDVHGMLAAQGILTSRGGRTSHAALVARQFGKPAVVGVSELEIDMAHRQMSVNDKIINWSQMDYNTRFSVDVGVAYGSDTKLVTDILLDCANKNKRVSKQPRPFVRFNNFGNSALEFQIYFWVKEPFWVENIKSELRYAIDDEFRKHNVQIPFPQRDIHIKSQLR